MEYKLSSEPTTWTQTTENASSDLVVSGLTELTAYDFRVRDLDNASPANASGWTTQSATTTATSAGYGVTAQSFADDPINNSSAPRCAGFLHCDDFEDGDATITCAKPAENCCLNDAFCSLDPPNNSGLNYAPNDGKEGNVTNTNDGWPGQGHGTSNADWFINHGVLSAQPGRPDMGFRSPAALRFGQNGVSAPGQQGLGGLEGTVTPSGYWHRWITPTNEIFVSFMIKRQANSVTLESPTINNDNLKLFTFIEDAYDGDGKVAIKLSPDPAGSGAYQIYMETEYPSDSRYPTINGWDYNQLKCSPPGTVCVDRQKNMLPDRWYAVMLRMKKQTVDDPGFHGSNGIVEFYVNDCGADSLGCPAGTTRTLVGSMYDGDFRDPSTRWYQIWGEHWENYRATGETLIDDFEVDDAFIPIRVYGNPAP